MPFYRFVRLHMRVKTGALVSGQIKEKSESIYIGLIVSFLDIFSQDSDWDIYYYDRGFFFGLVCPRSMWMSNKKMVEDLSEPIRRGVLLQRSWFLFFIWRMKSSGTSILSKRELQRGRATPNGEKAGGLLACRSISFFFFSKRKKWSSHWRLFKLPKEKRTRFKSTLNTPGIP